MQNESPPPLHPRTVEKMKSIEWELWANMGGTLDQIGEAITRTMRVWPPEKHAQLMTMFMQMFDAAEDDDYDTKALSGLGMLGLGSLLSEWHEEVEKGLHDKGKDINTGDDAE